MAQIFISYSRKDIDFVRRLAGDLEKAGYEVWWDLTDLRGGDDWPRVIPAAIEVEPICDRCAFAQFRRIRLGGEGIHAGNLFA